jgi:hypothetical protein
MAMLRRNPSLSPFQSFWKRLLTALRSKRWLEMKMNPMGMAEAGKLD